MRVRGTRHPRRRRAVADVIDRRARFDRVALAVTGVAVLALVGWSLALLPDSDPWYQWVSAIPHLLIGCIGAFLLLRTDARRLGWLLVLQTFFLLQFIGGAANAMTGADWAVVLDGMGGLPLGFLMAAIILYPTGRPASRVLALLVGLVVVVILFTTIHWTGANLGWWEPLADPLELAITLTTIPLFLSFFEQARIYRRRTPVEQKQVKWYVLGLVTAPAYAVPGILGWSEAAFTAVDASTTMLFPVAILVGVTRYRLYEIDRLVSRTVAYTVVLGMLVGLFVGSVAAITSLLPAQDRLAVAVTTMVVVALFDPVRRRVVDVVDRRFDRSRYRARQVVEQFGRSVADVADQAEVRAHLSRVLGTTLAPVTVAVWEAPSPKATG